MNAAVDIQALIDDIVERTKRVEGVRAIALGGSRARGSHTSKSDIDLCFYYLPEDGLDLEALDRVAAELDDRGQPGVLTPIGGWGPWVNGGGWLAVRGQAVDLLYRDLRRVREVIEACRRGRVDVVYQPGHPHAFVSAIYMAEVALCKPQWDADGCLSALRQTTFPYPPALKAALLEKFSWEAPFALETARKAADRADVAYAAGSCFRAVMCLLQTVFALNEEYWMNEKGAVALAGAFAVRPPRLRERVEEAFTLLTADGESIRAGIAVLEALQRDMAACVTRGSDNPGSAVGL